MVGARRGVVGIRLLGSFVAFAMALPPELAESSDTALRVESVVASGPAAKAGLQVDDRVLSWRCPSDDSPEPLPIDDYLNYLVMLAEKAQSCAGELHIARGKENRWIPVPPTTWRMEVRPASIPDSFQIQQTDLPQLNDSGTATARWRALAASLTGPASDERLWLWRRLIFQATHARAWVAGHAAVQLALEEPFGAFAQARLHEDAGALALATGRAKEAENYFSEAIRRYDALPSRVSSARARYWLARTTVFYGNYENGQIRAQEATDQLAHLVPGSGMLANSLNTLGQVEARLGNLSDSEQRFQLASEIQLELGGESFLFAGLLHNLAAVSMERGYTRRAQQLLYEALEILTKIDSDTAIAGLVWSKLGQLALWREDFDEAEHALNQALALQRSNSGVENLAQTLRILGTVARVQGQYSQAEPLIREALSIHQKIRPDSSNVASTLSELADLMAARGETLTALELHMQALDVFRKAAPGSLAESHGLQKVGRTALEAGQLDFAQESLEQTLDRLEGSGILGLRSVETMANLGAVALCREDRDEAERLFRLAIERLESQMVSLAEAPDERAEHRVVFRSLYLDYIALLIKKGRDEEAFSIAERYRARSFLQLLEERDLVFEEEIPASLAAEQRRVATRITRVQRQLLGGLDKASQTSDLLAELEKLRRERQKLALRVRRQSPRLAALQDPQPLSFEAVQSALSPGSVMLSYLTGATETFLFVITHDGPLAVVTLPLSHEQLSQRIARWRKLNVESSAWSTHGQRRRLSLSALSEQLYRELVQPAEEWIEGRERLILVGDGPLLDLPFSALRRAAIDSGRGEYLIEWKPLTHAASASTYIRLLERPPSTRTEVLTFSSHATGAPTARPESSILVRSVFDDFSLPPLPAAGWEAESIAALFPNGKALLQTAANETKVQELAGSARYLHFASHTLIDSSVPFDSALVLAPSVEGQDDGLLQVWEILESLRLDADLVTLSACESGQGRSRPGEGINAMTRAFHFAGARAVLTTLELIPDRASAELMINFYRGLRAGLAKDEALRQAQIRMVSQGRGESQWASPYYWAAFQLHGSWHPHDPKSANQTPRSESE